MSYEIQKVNLDSYAKNLAETAIAEGEDLKQMATTYMLIASKLLHYADNPEELGVKV